MYTVATTISRVDARKNRLSRFREFSYDISHVA